MTTKQQELKAKIEKVMLINSHNRDNGEEVYIIGTTTITDENKKWCKNYVAKVKRLGYKVKKTRKKLHYVVTK